MKKLARSLWQKRYHLLQLCWKEYSRTGLKLGFKSLIFVTHNRIKNASLIHRDPSSYNLCIFTRAFCHLSQKGWVPNAQADPAPAGIPLGYSWAPWRQSFSCSPSLWGWALPGHWHALSNFLEEFHLTLAWVSMSALTVLLATQVSNGASSSCGYNLKIHMCFLNTTVL